MLIKKEGLVFTGLLFDVFNRSIREVLERFYMPKVIRDRPLSQKAFSS